MALTIQMHVRAVAVRGARSYTAWARIEGVALEGTEARFAETLQSVVPQLALGLTARAEARWLLETLRKLNTDTRAVEVQGAGAWSAVAEVEGAP